MNFVFDYRQLAVLSLGVSRMFYFCRQILGGVLEIHRNIFCCIWGVKLATID